MPLADWLHKYPGVQRLMQQPDDVLEGVSAEAAPLAPPRPGTPRQRILLDHETAAAPAEVEEDEAWTQARVALLREWKARQGGQP